MCYMSVLNIPFVTKDLTLLLNFLHDSAVSISFFIYPLIYKPYLFTTICKNPIDRIPSPLIFTKFFRVVTTISVYNNKLKAVHSASLHCGRGEVSTGPRQASLTDWIAQWSTSLNCTTVKHHQPSSIISKVSNDLTAVYPLIVLCTHCKDEMIWYTLV